MSYMSHFPKRDLDEMAPHFYCLDISEIKRCAKWRELCIYTKVIQAGIDCDMTRILPFYVSDPPMLDNYQQLIIN